MTRDQMKSLLQSALESIACGDDEMLDRCLIELFDEQKELIAAETENRLWNEAKQVPGGYQYEGVCSSQLCFRLKDGGELRLMTCEADDEDGNPSDMRMHINHYGGELPPGITGPVWKTGEPREPEGEPQGPRLDFVNNRGE